MARLNASNPVGQYSNPLFSKPAQHSPLRPKQKTKKTTGSLDFKIFEDAQYSAIEEAEDPHVGSQTAAAAAAPLKLAHANSITSGLSKRASQESSTSASDRSRRNSSDEDDVESSDKENVFIEDEAEEATEEEEESENDEAEEESNLQGYTEREELDDSPQPPLVQRQKPGHMRYREPEPEVESDTQSERSADDEDGYGSLDDFIVSDNEDISYLDSGDDLPDDSEEEEEEEVKPPSPKPRRRRLLRGRKPRETGINLEELTISERGPSVHSPKASPSHTPVKDKTSPQVPSSFKRLLPDAHAEKAKRSPLRESINSLYV